MTQDLSFLRFEQPGWSTSWSQSGDLLTFNWEMPDTLNPSEQVMIGTMAHLDECGGDYALAAWHCVKHAVLHEAAEWLLVHGRRPYDPHLAEWWWKGYRAGPLANTEDQA